MTAASPHRCEFPVLPPHSIADPGPCECGKPYLAQIAEQRAAEAGLAVVDPEDLRAILEVINDPDTLRDDLTPRQDRAAMRLLNAVHGRTPGDPR